MVEYCGAFPGLEVGILEKQLIVVLDSSMVEHSGAFPGLEVGILEKIIVVLDSSMVEHSAVNRGVVGSSPTRGVFWYTLI